MIDNFDFYNSFYEKDGYIYSLTTNEKVAEDNSIFALHLSKEISDKLFSKGITTISGLILIGNAFLQHHGFSVSSINDIYEALSEYLVDSEEQEVEEDILELIEDAGDYDFYFDENDEVQVIENVKEEITESEKDEDFEFSFDFFAGSEDKEEIIETENLDDFGNIPIEELYFSVRTYNALKNHGINFLEDLNNYDEAALYQIKNMGAKSVKEVLAALNSSSIDKTIDENTKVDNLFISSKTLHCLHKNEITTLSQILKLSDLDIINLNGATKSVFEDIIKVRNKYIDKKDNSTYSTSLFFTVNNFYIKDNIIYLNNKSGHIKNVSISDVISDKKLIDILIKNSINTLFDILDLGYEGLTSLPGVGKSKVNKVISFAKEYVENNGIDYSNQEGSLKKEVRNTITSRIKDTSFEGMERVDLINELSLIYPKDIVIESVEELVLERILFIYEGDKLFFAYPSFPSFVYHKTKGLDRIRDIMFSRLEGQTLEEISERHSVTRELIRQQQEKFLKKCSHMLFREDRFKYLYETYYFQKDVFTEVFSEKDRTINYLLMKYKHGTKDISSSVEDANIPKRLRACIQKYLDRNKIEIDGVKIDKNDGLKYFIQKHITKATRIDDIVAMYNYFANTYGFEQLNDTAHNLEARIARIPNTVSSINKQIRYYNFSKYDFNELLESLNLDQYKDIQISTTILFEPNKKLMKKYDILNQYELHNILKQLLEKDKNIKFDRMPMITFGQFDRKRYLVDIIQEHGEIGVGKLAKVLYERIGLETLTSVWTNLIEEYKDLGVFKAQTQVQLDDNKINQLKLILTNTYYSKEEIITICTQLFKDFDISLVNTLNLSLLDFNVYSYYVIKKPQTSFSYISDLLTKDDVFNINTFPSITKSVMFNGTLNDLKREYEILEFENGSYINIRKLEGIGVTKQDILDYCKAVLDYVDEDYFTIHSLKLSGFASELEDLGFDNIFYEGILKCHPDFQFAKFSNVYVFKKNSQTFTRSMLIIDLINKYQVIEALDLLVILKDTYGIKTDLSLIKLLITDSEIYYNPIMDTFYKDYTTFIKEV